MNGNYEWQRQHAKQRIQNRYYESQQHRPGKRQNSGTDTGKGSTQTRRATLRLVTAILNLLR